MTLITVKHSIYVVSIISTTLPCFGSNFTHKVAAISDRKTRLRKWRHDSAACCIHIHVGSEKKETKSDRMFTLRRCICQIYLQVNYWLGLGNLFYFILNFFGKKHSSVSLNMIKFSNLDVTEITWTYRCPMICLLLWKRNLRLNKAF